MFLTALDTDLMDSSIEVVVVGVPTDEGTRLLLDRADAALPSHAVVLVKHPGNERELAQVAPYTEAQVMVDDQPTAYVCSARTCAAPTTDPAELEKTIMGFTALKDPRPAP
jgi:hypothetical protein